MFCTQRPLEVIFVCNYARANIDLDCCPSGQLHRVALCSESVRQGERSARGKVDAKATVVVVMIVFYMNLCKPWDLQATGRIVFGQKAYMH